VLAQIVQMVAQAQRSKAPMQRLADRVAGGFVLAVIGVAVLTFFAWGLYGPQPSWVWGLINAVAVLIIACPCALGLATPMSIMVATGKAATRGILFRDAAAIENLRRVDTLIVDKTGTLTEGRPVLDRVLAAPGESEDEVLRLAASLDQGSEHPLAAAIVRAARERGLALEPAQGFESNSGIGVRGTVGGRSLALGNAALMKEAGVADRGVRRAGRGAARRRARASSTSPQTAGCSASSPSPIRSRRARRRRSPPSARSASASSWRPATAARRRPLRSPARLGLEEVHAEVRPADKLALVSRPAARGPGRRPWPATGINDAPALAQADVGIAMGSGTDVAMNSAQVTLVKGDLRGIVQARRLSVETIANMKQNLGFAFVYNALGIPLAAGVLYPWTGWLLSPMIAALAMSLSSASVISNALRLRSAR
jgi:Cu+-exporting ATPase